MKEIILKSSKKKLITDCRSFVKDGVVNFVLEYVGLKPTGKTYVGKDGNEHNELKKSFENVFFSKNDLPNEYEKISDEEICQVLVGKNLVSQTILTD